jgi:hypothetical protein
VYLFLSHTLSRADFILASYPYVNQIHTENSKVLLSEYQLKSAKVFPLVTKIASSLKFTTLTPVSLPPFKVLEKPIPSGSVEDYDGSACGGYKKPNWTQNATAIAKYVKKDSKKIFRMFVGIPSDATPLNETDIKEATAEYKKFVSELTKKYSGNNPGIYLTFGKNTEDLNKVVKGKDWHSRAYKTRNDIFVIVLGDSDYSSNQNLLILKKSPGSKWTEYKNLELVSSCD